jgi:hypothetical protein
MGVFEEMNPELVRKLIEGHEDVLTPAIVALDAFYATFRCPRCRAPLVREFDSRHVFSDPAQLAPRALLRCPGCRYLIDPHSNVVLQFGDASKVPIDSIPPLGNK